MILSDFDYDLPLDRIAKEPARPRDSSRLLVVDRQTGQCTDSHFRDIGAHLRAGDLLVLNNTRVLRARLRGTLERTGRPIEVLLSNPLERCTWEALLGPGRRWRPGDRILLENEGSIVVGDPAGFGLRKVEVSPPAGVTFEEFLDGSGRIPLPPYLHRDDTSLDAVDYQTVFATRPGAIAAPTAGLHFSEHILSALGERDIETVEITLHVGAGTFIPVRTDDPAAHRLKPERYAISEGAAERLNAARSAGRRIIAVGTTSTRTLEYVFARHGRFVAAEGETDLYILPGHRFSAVDGLLTNFHLPRSTLLFLVSAFSSRDIVLDAYRHAIRSSYRFYSYGDCTFFL
jgi:S-adenosylmethionine:tRNA ribosyltransferase-isomerase